jgi:hypothetical protein
MIYTRRRIGIAAGTLAIGSAIMAVALPAGASSPGAHARPAATISLSTSQTLTLLQPSFSLFRGSASDRSGPPVVALAGATGTGADRRLAYSGTAGDVYASAHEGDLCVEYAFGGQRPGIASACAHADIGATLGAAVVMDRGGSMVLAAILPDGISSISVDRPGTTSAVIPVASNVAVYAGSPLRSWKFKDASGVNHEEALTEPPA